LLGESGEKAANGAAQSHKKTGERRREEVKMNKKILASIFVIGLLAFGLGYGTFSYFSSTEKAGITFTAGTPDLQLSLDGTSWYNSLTVTPPVWAPGDTYAIYVYVRNMGNIGLLNLYVTGNNLAGPNPGLANVINITDVAYTDTIGWVHPAGGTYYDIKFGNLVSPLTLTELANGATNSQYMKFCWGDGSTDYLPANGGMVQQFYIEFAFDQNAGNEYQGKSCSFDLVFIGTDDPFTPVWVP
jgi:predicted ribosomally synthesized peptide with SipW-like signal peptide